MSRGGADAKKREREKAEQQNVERAASEARLRVQQALPPQLLHPVVLAEAQAELAREALRP